MSRTRRVAATTALACAVVAGLAGCGGSPHGQGAPSSPASPDRASSTAASPSPTASTAAPRPTTAAVWASIGQLDPCQLSAAGRKVEYASKLVRERGATQCTSFTGAPRSEVTVEVGQPWDGGELGRLARIDIAGYTGYAGRTGADCTVVLPAGRTSVRFTALSQPDCGPVMQQANHVVKALKANPHAYDLATRRPVACQLLADAVPPAGAEQNADQCYAGAVGVWLVATVDTYRDDATVTLGATHAAHAIRSKRLVTAQNRTGCSVRWSVTPDIDAAAVAPSCARATALARTIVAKPWKAPDPGPLAFYPADGPGPV